ncbi:hypothetical protein [Flavisolibacter ginsenosidimutans]|uniref:Uncharacterized protein n=1 Tax=Flavisolibacter ginsenosidimutans TaxID=661481 RepID=A0A5B8UN18_9BACT|nr:hypothetical protein [Flavisolibacter ginsenosidimutans]QEC57978.1 hypothetical protein FSB75_19385 [Flavisolibacter ginsenosidimutans]
MIDNASSPTAGVTPDAKAEETETDLPYSLERLQPVPLSDAVLKQCRFVYHEYFKFWQLITGQDESRSEMDIDGDYNVIDFMRKPLVKKVASLHQLQNIYFMLKGKELAFQENA